MTVELSAPSRCDGRLDATVALAADPEHSDEVALQVARELRAYVTLPSAVPFGGSYPRSSPTDAYDTVH